MGNIYLRRNVYDKLLEWKRRSNRGTLELSGARQVGKTYLVNKFADEQYKRKIYISLSDLSGDLFQEAYNGLWEDMKSGVSRPENPVYEMIKRYDPNFIDDDETVVVIDEIQESAPIYNRIREFTRNLKCDFIITGSYLGRILDKSFKYSAGDIDSIEVNTLDFQEFLDAVGKGHLYEELDLYGNSDKEVYDEMSTMYEFYCEIGGYPSVVLEYLKSSSMQKCQDELLRIVRLFTSESRRYFEDILDDEIYNNIFYAIARILAKEKKGFKEGSFSEELHSIVVKEYSSNIAKVSINRAIDWLYSSGIIGFAGKVIDCNVLDFKPKARCYFMDIGLTNYFMSRLGLDKDQYIGTINENFVYLDLKRRINHPTEIAFETPAFATHGQGELDFFVKAMDGKSYAVEVKSGKNSSKTVNAIMENRKVDFVLYAKGNTQGGIKDNVYTIPIYGIGKFKFK